MMASLGFQGLLYCLPIHFVLRLLGGGLTLFAQGYIFDDQKNLTSYLFQNYKRNLRPFVNDSVPTAIYMGVWLISIVELQEKNQMLKFSAYLYMDWEDPSLAWNSSDYNGITQFAYPQQEMWIPDVTLINSVETMNQLGFDRNVLLVTEDGTVYWEPGGVFSTNCHIDITYYPFDTQKCQVIFSTVFSTEDEINLYADSRFSELWEYFTPSGVWDVIDASMETTADVYGKPRILFNIQLKRLRTFYVISLIVPVLFLAVTATLVFALPPDTGEKMGTSITVLLAYAVYLSVISDQMPKSSLNVSVLSLYVTFVLGITALGVVLSVLTLNLYFRDDDVNPPSVRMRKITVGLRRMMFCERKRNVVKTNGTIHTMRGSSSNSPEAEVSGETEPRQTSEHFANDSWSKEEISSLSVKGDNLKEVTWRTMSVTLDSFFFRSFSFLMLAATLACLVVFNVGAASE